MALATAEASTLPTTVAASRSPLARISPARVTSWSRIRFRTWRTLEADRRLWRSTARVPSRSLVFTPGTSAPPRSLLAGVELECPGRGEFAQLVTDHRLGHVDRDVLAPVVDRNGVADHVGNDRGTAGPRLDDLLVPGRVEDIPLLDEMVVYGRTFFQAARHGVAFPLFPYRRAPRVRRLRTIILSDSLSRDRVRPSGLPHGDTGWRPPDDLPSPPPNGWSTGFMATPRVCGRTPFQRLRPALPILISSASELDTTPRVARQSMGTRRISVEGRRRVAKAPSLATSWMLMPAPRAILPPWPIRSSTLWMVEPTGMKRMGSAFPGRISDPWPDCSRSPTAMPAGARM